MSTLSSVPKVPRDGIIDVATSALTLRLQYEDGDMGGDGWGANLAERLDFFDRGTVYGHRKGNDTFPTFSFSAHMTMFSCSVGGTIWDAVTKNAAGPWAAAVSTLGAFADWFTADITWSILGTLLGDGGDSIATFKKCDMLIAFTESNSPNKFNVSGTVLRPRESTFTLGTAA
jgi:hypothetical protein